MSKFSRLVSNVLLASLCAIAAEAQQADLILSTNAAVWNDVVEARIEGFGCSGRTSIPQARQVSGNNWVIDIDLLDCIQGPVSGETPFSASVEVGPLYPADYTVRVYDGDRRVGTPSIPPLDTSTLSVYREASLDIGLPEGATDSAPFSLLLSGPAYTSCFQVEEPVIEGHSITYYFTDNCPILPIPDAHIFEETVQLGPLPAGAYDVRFFEYVENPRPNLTSRTLVVHDADHCVPSATALCLQDGRFRVEVDWKDFEGHTGTGHPVPLTTGDDSGLFWFFQKENIELTVKALNGCGLNQSWWIFISSGSTVEFDVKVTDTQTARSKTYSNESGVAAPLIADTSAFSCTPNLDAP